MLSVEKLPGCGINDLLLIADAKSKNVPSEEIVRKEITKE